jgi:hypothetical protein
MTEFIETVAQVGVENAVVHGALIAVVGLLVAGFSCLATRLGRNSLIARAGLVAYGLGAIAMSAAALVSGFIVTQFLAPYRDRPEAELEMVRHILGLCRTVNQVCSSVGVMGMAVAVLLWSSLLVRRSGPSFAVGVLGCVAGAGLVIGVLSGHLRMDVHGMLAFTLVQLAWSVGVSVLLFGRRF